MTHRRERSGNDHPQDAEPGRQDRPYPHGTGDRNAWAPRKTEPMPVHEGGTQRRSPPSPDAGGGA